MRSYLTTFFVHLFCRRKLLFLALCCILGFSCGLACIHLLDEPYFSLLCRAPETHVSPSGLIVFAAFPFLITALAIYTGYFWLLFCVCFGKMFLFGIGAAGVYCSFGSASWLMHLLLCFSDCCLIPVLCWFCIRRFSCGLRSVLHDLVICSAVIAVISFIDIYVVSPFLASLI